MNEKIKELWNKASVGTFPSGSNSWESQVNFIEKFSELIIKECLDQCYHRGMNDELYAGQLRAAAYIEEHFGVE